MKKSPQNRSRGFFRDSNEGLIGNYFFTWHLRDFCSLILHCLDNSVLSF